MPSKAEPMMTREGHPDGQEPTAHVGHQGVPHDRLDQHDDRQPVHRSSNAAHGNEPDRTGGARGHQRSSGQAPSAIGSGAIVCLCADDFGLNEGVNSAVQQLVTMERVHATSALVGSAAWHGGIGFLRRMHAQGLDVGLHLDFTEHPLAGQRLALGSLVLQSHLGQLERATVRREIRAQLDAFEDGVGHAPSFVDGHQHVHQFPVIRDELLEELEERYGGYPPWIRRARLRARASAAAGFAGLLKSAMIAALGAPALATSARRHGLPQNRALLGVYDFAGGAPHYLKLLRGWLSAAREGDLLMCHPGRALASGDPLSAAREAEYQALASRHFGQLIRELGVVLWPMSHILADAD